MATNADEVATDDGAAAIETDLHKLKYPDEGVETAQNAEDETLDEDTGTDAEDADDADSEDVENNDQAADDSIVEPPSFVKEFAHIKGETPEEYAKNLEEAYRNSTSEAMRLKALVDTKTAPNPLDTEEDDDSEDPAQAPIEKDPAKLWVNQRIDKEIADAFEEFKVDFPQVDDPVKYEQFTNEVKMFSKAIMDSQKRMASPAELYQKAAISLGWEKQSVPTDKEKLGMALKETAAVSKAPTSGAKPAPKSSITDAQIAAYRKTTGTSMSDAEIRKELEPYSN